MQFKTQKTIKITPIRIVIFKNRLLNFYGSCIESLNTNKFAINEKEKIAIPKNFGI